MSAAVAGIWAGALVAAVAIICVTIAVCLRS
jgi:hypothetical protein